MNKEKLVLFDVDGTIIEQNNIIEYSLIKAFRSILNIDISLKKSDYIGKTDFQIIQQLIERYKINDSNDQKLHSLLSNEYSKILIEEIPNFKLALCLCIKDLIIELSKEACITLGLLTGNIEQIVKPKLKYVGINFRKFKIGAFGSDSFDRYQLPRIALERYNKKYGKNLLIKSVYLIGDTPEDIKSAKSSGAKIISIASGIHSFEDLKVCDPDYLFHSACYIIDIKNAILRN